MRDILRVTVSIVITSGILLLWLRSLHRNITAIYRKQAKEQAHMHRLIHQQEQEAAV